MARRIILNQVQQALLFESIIAIDKTGKFKVSVDIFLFLHFDFCDHILS